jgi:2-C-methyl-D-erythritol 4-phosphate cytidylyltransferase
VDVTAIVPVPAAFAERPGAVFAPVAGQSPLIRITEALSRAADVVVAATGSLIEPISEVLSAQGLSDIPVAAAHPPGDRASCVAAGLAVRSTGDHVLVHDITWPVTDPATVHRILTALRSGAQVVAPALPVTDSIKEVDDRGVVTATLDRSELQVLQYPRGFDADLLLRLLTATAPSPPDELDAALSAGVAIHLIDGDPEALCVELPRDARYLAAVIEDRQAGSGR